MTYLWILLFGFFVSSCATLPEPKMERVTFPQNAYMGDVKSRPYKVLGTVKSRIDFISLDPNHDEKELCKNYFNKSVRELLRDAKKQGADAVLDVKSVVFYEDGKSVLYPTPECSDDGAEGQVLTQGIAVRWKRYPEEESRRPSAPPPSKNTTGFVPVPNSP